VKGSPGPLAQFVQLVLERVDLPFDLVESCAPCVSKGSHFTSFAHFTTATLLASLLVNLGRENAMKQALWIAFVAASAFMSSPSTFAQTQTQTQTQRGEYLVTIMDCTGCHTPGTFLGKPDMQRPLAGSEVGFQVPGLGIFYPPNLTPDPETGLGKWSEADIKKAVRTGVRPDGRQLVPVMPYHSYGRLTDTDERPLSVT
jgi:mono/diheme cytochrome c family protein